MVPYDFISFLDILSRLLTTASTPIMQKIPMVIPNMTGKCGVILPQFLHSHDKTADDDADGLTEHRQI